MGVVWLCGELILFGSVVIVHLSQNRKLSFNFAPYHSVVIVLALLQIALVIVLNGQIIVSLDLSLRVISQPRQLQLLFETQDGFIILSQFRVTFTHQWVSHLLGIIVLIFLGCVSELLEVFQSLREVLGTDTYVTEKVHRLFEQFDFAS